MIPFFEQPSLHLGPVTIHAFGVLVAIAVAVGLRLGERRFHRLGLDAALGERMAWWMLAGGLTGAHLFAVLFYFPGKIAADPLILLRVWDPISSFGAIVGGLLGVWLFFRVRHRGADAAMRLQYLDVAAFVFPVSLFIGRIGCALAHDHPGRVTSFPLAISLESPDAQRYIADVYAVAGKALPDGVPMAGFHDLGLYEALYLGAVVVPVVIWLARRPRTPGFFLAAFVALYMPVRFALDFLRVSDARYAGLTPAQWVALAALVTLAGVLLRGRPRSAATIALAGAALATACLPEA